MQEEYSTQTFSATDKLKHMILDKLSKTLDMGCKKEERINNNTYETGFIRGVKFLKSMMWKYAPPEMRKAIKELYNNQEKVFKEIEATNMSDENKILNKQKIADETSLQVLELLLVVIQYSPMSTEYKEIEVFGDFQDIIKTIRKPEPVKMFSGEIENE